jgi:lipoprotein-anchoring transpeptidase ErfK/SrfK
MPRGTAISLILGLLALGAPGRLVHRPVLWDAKATDTKATIKPGPNNPVGVVWIDLNAEHYGIHGTPEPARIGYSQSHGCVRLTNWDAARVAALVGPNTPVIFK